MYQVLQGKISNSGCGDYLIIKVFENLEDAKALFNAIKEDKNGWCLSAREHLETLLIKNNNFDDILGYWACE